jgi:hypothetical protein
MAHVYNFSPQFNAFDFVFCFVFPALFKDLFRWFFFPGSFPFMAHLDACVSFDVTHCHAKNNPATLPEKTSDWTCPAAAASIPERNKILRQL